VIYVTNDLFGPLLDAAVAKAEGIEYEVSPFRVNTGCGITFVTSNPVCLIRGNTVFEPSTSWKDGGPIVDRERIHLQFPFPLLHAMRSHVTKKLGPTVEL